MLKDTKTDSAPSPRTTKKSEAQENVPSSEIKLSSQAVSFREKVNSQPCMSFLPGQARWAVRGNTQENKAPEKTLPGKVDIAKIIDADSHMITEAMKTIRKDAATNLNYLIRFDDQVDTADAQILCSALNVISRLRGAA
jgi:hypothetical protein